METIAAIATPLAEGGLSVIRISGDNAADVAKKVFVPVSGRDVAGMKGYTACYGEICDNGVRLDDGVLLIYRAPHSYTGEDTAEITCHGGIYITKRVLSACLDAGAVPAGAGEFTKRALLNGKLSLTQAEAVADIISARNEQFLLLGRSQREGALYRRIRGISDELLSFVTLVQAWIDYPDEVEEDLSPEEEAKKLRSTAEKLATLLKSYSQGQIIRDGIPCAIVGRPNAGKSTLMNLLTGEQRSIVTDIEGTTRDIVEETVMLGDIMLRLSDCAGIRETNDIVEGIGVERMLKRLDEASLVLAVFDGSRELSEDDERLMDRLKDKETVCILNKNDLDTAADIKRLEQVFGRVYRLSARDEKAIDIIKNAVSEHTNTSRLDPAGGFIANERQRSCAQRAYELTVQAYEALEAGVTLDAAGVLCENALQCLYELSGERASEAVIDEVFRRFCVGK